MEYGRISEPENESSRAARSRQRVGRPVRLRPGAVRLRSGFFDSFSLMALGPTEMQGLS